jgi:hypothetical protein
MEEQVFLAGTQGSSSMKRFLPAVLKNSKSLQDKYSRPIYGTELIPSKNFSQMTWITNDETGIRDPYHLLNPIFQDAQLSGAIGSLEQTEGPVIANGAAAMMAYASLIEGKCYERTLSNELKRYCELDNGVRRRVALRINAGELTCFRGASSLLFHIRALMAHFSTPAIPKAFREFEAVPLKISPRGTPRRWVNAFSDEFIGPNASNLYATETLLGDWEGRVLILAQDALPARSPRNLIDLYITRGTPRESAWCHAITPSVKTALHFRLVSQLRSN